MKKYLLRIVNVLLAIPFSFLDLSAQEVDFEKRRSPLNHPANYKTAGVKKEWKIGQKFGSLFSREQLVNYKTNKKMSREVIAIPVSERPRRNYKRPR